MYPHQGTYYNGQFPQPPPGYYSSDMPPPVTPLDMSYGQSMLPSNLLMNSPYVRQAQNMVPMSPLLPRQYAPPALNLSNGSLASHQQYHRQSQPQHSYPNQSPYLTPLSSNSNLDQLNLSRTIILKNLSEDLTLNELLNVIDYGPIEYCKMFSKPAPHSAKDADNLKTCVISFVNSKISINFHIKYSRNRYNLNNLKEKLKNSKYLKISLNESTNANSGAVSNNNFSNNYLNKQDYIKLKTLNYILDFNATRCLLIKLSTKSLVSFNLGDVENDVYEQCAKFGEIENFKTSSVESRSEVKCLVHFTSIDAAIKSYEYYLKRIQIDKQNQIDQEGKGKNEDIIEFTQVVFYKDRCDRTVIDKPKSTTSSDSPGSIKKHPRVENKSIPEDLNENIPVIDGSIEGDDEKGVKKDVRALNAQNILEDSESIRNSFLSNSKHSNISNFDQISSSSSSSQNIDQGNLSNASSYMTSGGYQPHMRMQVPQAPTNNSAAPYQYNPDPFNVGNRTIYLGNLHPNTSIEEIANNVRAGGLVESIKYHPDKKVCFITFVDPTIALKFYLNHQVLHQLIIHGYDITVGWAKNHSGPLNREISLAVTAGASRNVYIGIKLNKDENNTISSVPKVNKISLPNEVILRSDFSKFGELEQINFYHNKDCGFLNFINIMDGIRLVELFEYRNIQKINKIAGDNGEFYEKYNVFKISFAKDRCGNPPKFSFKKKFGSKKNKIPNNLEEETIIDKQEEHEEEPEVMNEETAMVFGIISNTDSNKNESNKEEDGKDKNVDENAKELKDEKNKTEKPKIQNNESDERSDNDVDEEADEDDDISIIIGSDDTSSTTAINGNRDDSKKSRNNNKFYGNKVNSSDAFIPLRNSSRNSSNLSLNSHNSNHMKYYNHPDNSKFPPSPFIQQQQLYYNSNHQRPPTSRMNSHGYGGYYNPQNPNPNQYTYHGGSSKNPYSTSGSQVMQQYLAKSQHDNLLYAASILSNDVGISEDNEYEYKQNNRRNSKR